MRNRSRSAVSVSASLAGRMALLRDTLTRRGIQAHLITHLPNVRYLSGFTGSSGWLLVGREETWFITDGRYRTQAEEEVQGAFIVIAKPTMHDQVGKLVAGTARSLGVEAAHVSIELGSQLRRSAGVRLRATRGLVEQLRQRKAEGEVRALTRAARIAERAFLRVKDLLRPGTSERSFALALESAVKEGGSRRVAFDTIVASGPRGALPHASPGSRKFKPGDLVVVDWGAEYNGYFSDMTRTFCVGKPAGDARHIYDIVLRAQRAALGAIAPGVGLRAVDEAARRVIRQAGMNDFFSHGTGHGVGLEVHEAPTLSPRARGSLEEGMVVTVEPGIYVPGVAGVRIEDMALVTGEGSRRLTVLPKRFECLG